MAGPPSEIWLIRHGETEWSRSGRHTGRTDVPLTERGEREASALRRRLGGHRFSLVLSSPLARAWETCLRAGCGDVAVRSDDLVERDYGAYEGRTSAEIRAEVPGWSLWTDGLPGGETAEQVAARARRIVARAAQAGGDVALFAHGHVLRVLAACWVGSPPGEGRVLALGTASIGVLGWENGDRVIWTWNLVSGAP
jgi:probable phosphoglycerate mutase